MKPAFFSLALTAARVARPHVHQTTKRSTRCAGLRAIRGKKRGTSRKPDLPAPKRWFKADWITARTSLRGRLAKTTDNCSATRGAGFRAASLRLRSRRTTAASKCCCSCATSTRRPIRRTTLPCWGKCSPPSRPSSPSKTTGAKHPDFVFYDKQTGLIDRFESVIDGKRTAITYDDYRSTKRAHAAVARAFYRRRSGVGR